MLRAYATAALVKSNGRGLRSKDPPKLTASFKKFALFSTQEQNKQLLQGKLVRNRGTEDGQAKGKFSRKRNLGKLSSLIYP